MNYIDISQKAQWYLIKFKVGIFFDKITDYISFSYIKYIYIHIYVHGCWLSHTKCLPSSFAPSQFAHPPIYHSHIYIFLYVYKISLIRGRSDVRRPRPSQGHCSTIQPWLVPLFYPSHFPVQIKHPTCLFIHLHNVSTCFLSSIPIRTSTSRLAPYLDLNCK